MIALLWLLLAILAAPIKSNCQREAENIALRHQVVVLRRQLRGRVRLTNLDRLVLVQLYRWFPSILNVLAIACTLGRGLAAFVAVFLFMAMAA